MRGVSFVLQGANILGAFGSAGLPAGAQSYGTMLLLQGAFALGVGAISAWKSAPLARRLFPQYREAYFTAPMAAFQTAALAVAGLALAAYSVPRTVVFLVSVVSGMEASPSGMFLAIVRSQWAAYVEAVVGLVVGLGLYAGAGRLSRSIQSSGRGAAS
jgi:hypothetical protein